jgi:hypothetical protein
MDGARQELSAKADIAFFRAANSFAEAGTPPLPDSQRA